MDWGEAVGTAVITALAVYGALVVFFYMAQSTFIYAPSRHVALSPAMLGLATEDVRLGTVDGETVAGWYVPAEGAARTVLFLHGNAGNIGDRVEVVKTLHDIGLNVLIIDYRGYGNSTGRPSEEGTYNDAVAAWEWLAKQKGIPPSRIVVYGRSLGGAVACWLAAKEDPGGLVTEATFTSVPDMAAHRYPMMPARAICRFRYDALATIARVKCPVLVIHAADDTTVPFEHGRKIFEAAPEPKQFVSLEGDHIESSLESPFPACRAAFRKFLQRLDAPREAEGHAAAVGAG